MNKIINAVIVEDEESNQRVLCSFLNKYCPNVNIASVSGTVSKAILAINKYKPNLVFLDIKLDNNHTAFDLLEQLNELNFFIVFVTAYDEYAKKAINDTDAIFYLTKPIKITELEKAVQLVQLKLNEGMNIIQDSPKLNTIKSIVNPLNKIMCPTKDGFEFLDINNIIRIQALGNYIQLFSTDNKRYTIYNKLSYYEEQLTNFNFLKVHRSHLINLPLVIEFKKVGRGGIAIMADNSSVQIAPSYKQTFLSNFNLSIVRN